LAQTGGGSTTYFAGNAAATANSLTALLYVLARYTRASEKRDRNGIVIGKNAAYERRSEVWQVFVPPGAAKRFCGETV
jgi:hypothetical protein